MVSNSSVLLSYIDRNQRYLYCNDAYRACFALPSSDIVGSTLKGVLGRYNYGAVMDYFPVVLQGGKEVSYRRAAIASTGKERLIQVTLTPHFNEHGDILGSSAYAVDIAQAPGAFQQTSFPAIPALSEVLVHELNQPLTSLQIYLQGCLSQLTTGIASHETLITAVEKVAKQTERVAGIIDNFSQLSQASTLNVSRENIPDLIRATMVELNPALTQSNIKVYFDFDAALSCIDINKVLIVQALKNIIQNAIRILTKAQTISPQIDIKTIANNQGCLKIVIRNNGPEIPSPHLPFLFQAGYSTQKQGHGLGLWLVKLIIEAHGGSLTLDSNVSGNVAFAIEL